MKTNQIEIGQTVMVDGDSSWTGILRGYDREGWAIVARPGWGYDLVQPERLTGI